MVVRCGPGPPIAIRRPPTSPGPSIREEASRPSARLACWGSALGVRGWRNAQEGHAVRASITDPGDSDIIISVGGALDGVVHKLLDQLADPLAADRSAHALEPDAEVVSRAMRSRAARLARSAEASIETARLLCPLGSVGAHDALPHVAGLPSTRVYASALRSHRTRRRPRTHPIMDTAMCESVVGDRRPPRHDLSQNGHAQASEGGIAR